MKVSTLATYTYKVAYVMTYNSLQAGITITNTEGSAKTMAVQGGFSSSPVTFANSSPFTDSSTTPTVSALSTATPSSTFTLSANYGVTPSTMVT